MPNIIEITDFSAPELDVYARLTQAQLRNRLEPEKGVFIAESPKVIARALDAGYVPLSLLMERRQITGPAQDILTRCGDAPVYTADREMLARLTGYELTRGVLCAFRRPAPLSVEEVCRNARRVAVLEGIVDSTNVGAIFRSAAATCIIPMQDWLGLDNSARINKPSTVGENWRWRLKKTQLTKKLQKEICQMTTRYGRKNWA